MVKMTREKIALCMFVLLLALAAGVVFSYFSTARSFNLAATMVDDTVGQMEGYTALVYRGTLQEDLPTKRPSAEGLEDERLDEAYNIDASEADAEVGFDEPGLAEIKRTSQVFVSDLRAAYELKGAKVFTINTSDPTYYAVPTLLSGGGKTIGVIGANVYLTRAELRNSIADLEDQGAELIVCVARSTVLLGQFDGIDVVIVTGQAGDVSMTGTEVDGTLLVQAPYENAAGVVMVTSRHVMSARVVEEL